MSNDWKCSKCGKEPEVMHSVDPNVCAECYDSQPKTEPTVFNQGDRVATPDGDGTVVYIRMASPDYAEVSTVSVVLDKKKNQPGYTGSAYLAEVVTAIAKPVSRNRRGQA